MNKKIVTGGLTLGVLYAFVFASTASAFWPFDALFKKSGDVKAETSERAYIPERTPQTGKAYMTYQTLVSMNDACRKMFAQEYPTPTRPKVTPSSKGPATADMKLRQESATNAEKMYQMETGIESRNEKELTAIYNNLKARCENVANLVSRMQKIYKGNARPTVSSTPSPVKIDDDGATRPTIIKYGDDGMERPSNAPTRKPIINFRLKESSENKE